MMITHRNGDQGPKTAIDRRGILGVEMTRGVVRRRYEQGQDRPSDNRR
jgi:hypothetical protein